MDLVSRSSLAAAVLQVGVVVAGLVTAAIAPPTTGAMLAVPLSGTTLATTINLALAAGATIEGPGPISGSVVVRGERRRLFGPMRAHGVALLAASAWMCGK
ncbi:hypothetical protein [Sphingomonas sp.]|uniref:hypothetical protein n=1 Tax=Sphingomonas sp. TaxID=28214 RepID=UPI003AFFE7A5